MKTEQPDKCPRCEGYLLKAYDTMAMVLIGTKLVKCINCGRRWDGKKEAY